jgi:uncharacterized membrane protein
MKHRIISVALVTALLGAALTTAAAADPLTPAEAKTIAVDAYVYGYSL